MTEREKQLVRESFVELREVTGPLGMLFYGRLFSLEPDLRTMFPRDIAAQGKKLMEMLTAAVEGMDKWETLKPALRAMGQRHAGYGAETRHYRLVEEALVWSIGQALSAGADAEVKRAWSRLIEEVGAEMRAGVGPLPTGPA